MEVLPGNKQSECSFEINHFMGFFPNDKILAFQAKLSFENHVTTSETDSLTTFTDLSGNAKVLY